MVHGRVIRPPVAGATPVSVDESSIKDIPGAKVVRDKDLLGVVADNEWNAIKAAQALKVEWSQAQPPFVDNAGAVYDHIRKAPVRKRTVEKENGNVDEAFRSAARVIEAEYEWPFQSHASMGPGCGVVAINGDQATVWTGSPKPHYCRDGVAALLGMPADKVEAHSFAGSGAYGRNDAGEACMEAAVLARAVGKPVRVQYMRSQGTGWDPKGPASIHRARAAVDASGKVVAYEYASKGFSRLDMNSNESKPWDVLAGHLLGVALKSGDAFGAPAESYAFDNKRLSWETIAPLLDRASGKIWARKFTVAHDCGQIINPNTLKQTIEGNVIQGTSRTLWEEVALDRKNVTSVDWVTYPILDITEAPQTIDVVLINHPELAPTGAGEPSSRPIAAAIGNAIFDATGVRLRRVPFTPDKVRAAFS